MKINFKLLIIIFVLLLLVLIPTVVAILKNNDKSIKEIDKYKFLENATKLGDCEDYIPDTVGGIYKFNSFHSDYPFKDEFLDLKEDGNFVLISFGKKFTGKWEFRTESYTLNLDFKSINDDLQSILDGSKGSTAYVNLDGTVISFDAVYNLQETEFSKCILDKYGFFIFNSFYSKQQ